MCGEFLSLSMFGGGGVKGIANLSEVWQEWWNWVNPVGADYPLFN